MKSKFIIVSTIFSLLLNSCSAAEPDSPGNINGVEHHDIVIVGAGIAGLSCGYHLGKKDFLILE